MGAFLGIRDGHQIEQLSATRKKARFSYTGCNHELNICEGGNWNVYDGGKILSLNNLNIDVVTTYASGYCENCTGDVTWYCNDAYENIQKPVTLQEIPK